MTDEAREQKIRQFVAAFADGELDLEQTIEVLSRLTIDPGTTARVEHQQRLREAVCRVMQGPECKDNPTRCPEALRREIEKVCREAAAAETGNRNTASGMGVTGVPGEAAGGRAAHARRPSVIASIGRWFPLAAAAAVLIVGAAGLFLAQSAGVEPFHSRLLSPALAERFDARHTACSSDVSELYQHVKFPDDVAALPEAVAGVIDHGVEGLAPLDLSVMGYRYVQAGRCEIPGTPAVHVVYHATDADASTGSAESMSLWITPDRGQLDALEPGRLYVARVPDTGHPLMLWREDGLFYYLLGETMPTVESAANLLHAPGDRRERV